MNVTRYNVVCSVCNGSSRVEIDSMDRIYWYDTDKVISARKRLDGQWGWQCACGNNDIMTEQEINFIENPTNPKPKEIQQVVDNLVIQEPKFEMRSV